MSGSKPVWNLLSRICAPFKASRMNDIRLRPIDLTVSHTAPHSLSRKCRPKWAFRCVRVQAPWNGPGRPRSHEGSTEQATWQTRLPGDLRRFLMEQAGIDE